MNNPYQQMIRDILRPAGASSNRAGGVRRGYHALGSLDPKEKPMQLKWNKCTNDKWCPLNTVNLEDEHFDDMEGVYIIWHGGQSPKTVRVGQGIVRERFAMVSRRILRSV